MGGLAGGGEKAETVGEFVAGCAVGEGTKNTLGSVGEDDTGAIVGSKLTGAGNVGRVVGSVVGVSVGQSVSMTVGYEVYTTSLSFDKRRRIVMVSFHHGDW